MMFPQQLNNHRIFKRSAKALIRLSVSAGWSEPLLVAHTTLLVISCHGSIIISFSSLQRSKFDEETPQSHTADQPTVP